MYNNAQQGTTMQNAQHFTIHQCTTIHALLAVTQCSVITPTHYNAALSQYIPTLNKPATFTEPTMCCSELFRTNLLTRLGAFSRTGHGSARHFLDGPQVRVLYNIISRLLRDPGISRDPGIFWKSRSQDSQKSNPRIFQDFQKPLNDCILRLSTPFIDHINLFWDIWLLQEGQK